MDARIALTYRRVSTYKQERDGVSLDVQTDQCLDYIRRQPGWRLGGDFSDTLTGRTAKRKDYQALLQEARDLRVAGQRVVIVAAALDRMGRDLLESVKSRKELRSLDVPLHCVREGGVLSETQANLYATIAQDESDRIGVRVAGARKRRREHGYCGPSKPTWGYVRAAASDRERLAGSPEQVLRRDPRTVEYVREAWARVAAGESVRQVATWAAQLPSEARGGRVLDFANIRRMFGNPVYIARVDNPERGAVVAYATDPVTGEQTVTKRRRIVAPDTAALALPSGRWEAIVDDATWTRVQEQIARHQRMPKQARGEYLLTGVLRCPKDGGRMRGQAHAGGRLYVCNHPGQGCYYGGRAAPIDASALEQIGALLDPLAGGAALRKDLRGEWARLQRPPERPRQARIKSLERTITRARTRQDEMLSLLADRVITRERYDRGVEAEQRDIVAAERELAEIRAVEAPPVLPPFDEALRKLGGWVQALRGKVVPEQREVLSELIERVVPVRIARGKYTAEVKWTPLGEALGEIGEQVA